MCMTVNRPGHESLTTNRAVSLQYRLGNRALLVSRAVQLVMRVNEGYRFSKERCAQSTATKPFMPAGTLDGSRVPATYQTREAHMELYAAIGVLLVVVLLAVVVGGIWKDRL